MSNRLVSVTQTQLLFIAILALFGGVLHAQKASSFSSDHKTFLSELEDHMTYSKSNMLEDVYDEFEDKVKSDLFTPVEMDSVISLSRLMLDRNMTVNPYYKDFLEILTGIKSRPDHVKSFKRWTKVYREMLRDRENQRNQHMKQFLDFSRDFYVHNTLRYSRIGSSWTALFDDYEFVYSGTQPKLIFNDIDLICYRKDDSIRVYGTSGTCLPLESTWKGEDGVVDWKRFGDDQDISCQLGTYEIELKKGFYRVDSVVMTFPEFFPGQRIKGSFEDKLSVRNQATEGSYPKFESFSTDLTIDNLGGGVNYRGGLRLNGLTAYGFGDKEQKALIRIDSDGGERLFKGLTDVFVIRKDERIAGQNVETTLYFKGDSIYHPSVDVRFEMNEKVLKLNRGDRASNRNPYYDSYHNMQIGVEKMDWYLEQDSMVIGSKIAGVGTSDREVIFESFQYFDPSDYYRIQNIGTTNPIDQLKLIADRENTRVLHAYTLAESINPDFTTENIQTLLYELVAEGFINYDSDEEIVEIKDKVIHYSKAVRDKVDYDKLRIESKTEDVNGTFDVAEGIISVNGVNRVEFSSNQKVACIPDNKEVDILKNRSLAFDGLVLAGFSHLRGDQFYFDYDNFHIKLDSVRYFDLFVPTGDLDRNENPVALSIGSRIEHLNGFLLIDAPSNKAGREEIAVFPTLESKGPSYVFYDDSTTQKGCYQRDSFYYELEPFSFSSLDKYTKEDVRFAGKLVSADIFPDFKQELTIQEVDQSLGFVHRTPENGYATYLGKGTYTGEVLLNNTGLLGKGNLQYLGASIDSEDIVFRPDDLTGSAEEFFLEEDRTPGLEIPQVFGQDVNIHWRPYNDSMYVNSQEEAFDFYKEEGYTLNGELVLTPGGLNGNGAFDFEKGTMRSDLFSFGAFSINSDTTDLTIRAVDADELAFDTKNVKGEIDFDEQLGSFQGNSTGFTTYMPHNEYVTNLNDFDWDLEEGKIIFKSEPGQYGTFVSVHPDQDSLKFKGDNAVYNLEGGLLQVEGVSRIRSADAFIFPPDSSVTVQARGYMDSLLNAKIICDTSNQNHVITDASVAILGRKHYEGSGYYQYDIQDKEQDIWFEHIVGQRVGKGKWSEKDTETRAKGNLEESDSFYIDYKTRFQGEISLNANSKNLFFSGFARIDTEKLPNPHWFTVRFEGDKEDLAIQYDEPKNPEGAPIRNGFYLSKETAELYPSIMAPLYFRKDRPIIDVRGMFKYNPRSDHFIFGDSLRILGQSDAGNLLVYDNREGEIEASGTLNLGSALRAVNVKSAGRIYGNLESILIDSTRYGNENAIVRAEAVAGIEIILPEKLWNIVANDLQSYSFEAKDIRYERNTYYANVYSEMVEDPEARKNLLDKLLVGQFELPKKLNPYSLLFDKLELEWITDYQSFVSTGDKLGIITINGQPIHKEITGFIEFKMPTNEDDRLYIYLKSPGGNYYFFAYKQGILNTVSNNTQFNDEIINMKKKERIQKLDDGFIYEIQPVNPGSAEMFVRRVKAAHD